MTKKYQNQQILVLGMGLSGCAMVSFLSKRGAIVTGFDDGAGNKNFPCKVYSSINQVNFKEISSVVYSPGIKSSHPVFQAALKESIPLVGEIELGAREIKNPCIAVTGTNGKSTVVSLITHLLNTANKPALSLGNIGIPITSAIDNLTDEILVLELSSYQLEALKTPCIDLGLFLNLTPDHLDRYQTMERYAEAKFLMQKALKSKASFFIEKSLQANWSKFLQFKSVYFFNDFLDHFLDEIDEKIKESFKYISPFEKLNFSAAIAVSKSFGVTNKDILHGLKSFNNLPHRCEFVKSVKQVKFYNDSKATNIESVIKAVTSFREPLIMIMGGEDKELDFSLLVPYFMNKVKKICLIGESRSKMYQLFSPHFNVEECICLEDAIKLAYQNSQPNDTVLLSPAASSFDMFQNFEHRGNEFKKIVNQLEGERV
ncbi:MAG: UDP-N-acetylmuramoylalanine--D-glutamate ligase [Chlamydiae bacterium]|nr:UDP-N-acetylmuramoylalanine--D-glutamate ligase [Chlamydiota bacterium]